MENFTVAPGFKKTEPNARLEDDILHMVIAAGGAEAVSYLHRTLTRYEGWCGLGCLADFESTCRKLGFTVRQGKNSRGQARTEVTL